VKWPLAKNHKAHTGTNNTFKIPKRSKYFLMQFEVRCTKSKIGPLSKEMWQALNLAQLEDNAFHSFVQDMKPCGWSYCGTNTVNSTNILDCFVALG
jgi:hypothetical protein